jgi:hypothetical protein
VEWSILDAIDGGPNKLAQSFGVASMPKGEIVGRFMVGSELVIDGNKNDGK